jgi:dihydroflavonol-4-reductase
MDGKILVTGSNGHLGLNLCKALIGRGADVRASVRDAGSSEKTAALKGVGVTDFVSLDVRDGAAFEKAAEQVDTLFHVAATYRYATGGEEADDSMLRDSLDGAENALRAAAKAGVRKVVLTSSTVTLPTAESREDKKTEEDWRTSFRVPYMKAKTLAEQRAWALAEELDINLATVLPGALLGGIFTKPTQSTDYVENIVKGGMRMATFDSDLPFADVEDVVEAHILVAEQDARGRFIACADHFPSFSEIIATLHSIDPRVKPALMIMPRLFYPTVPPFDMIMHKVFGLPRVATRQLVAELDGGFLTASNEKARRELGWKHKTSLEDSLRKTLDQLRTLGRI